MSNIELPLDQGWNQIGYPLAVSAGVSNTAALDASDVLTPLESVVTAIYRYDASNSEEAWSFYGPISGTKVSAVLDTIEVFDFGQGYQIYATEPITLLMSAPAIEVTASLGGPPPVTLNASRLQAPPSVFVATLPSGDSPALDTIQVSMGREQCNNSIVTSRNRGDADSVIITVHAIASTPPPCFTPGSELLFEFNDNGVHYSATADWDNQLIQELVFVAE